MFQQIVARVKDAYANAKDWFLGLTISMRVVVLAVVLVAAFVLLEFFVSIFWYLLVAIVLAGVYYYVIKPKL